MKTKFTMASWVLIAVCLLFMIPATLQAQELRGKITGRVMDPNGAAVPGANVKVTDVARSTTTTFTTNADGLFDALYLLAGTYQVVVEASGFKKSLQDKVQVEINQTRHLDISLDVGRSEETVTVTAEAATLNASDANLGQTIDRKRVDE